MNGSKFVRVLCVTSVLTLAVSSWAGCTKKESVEVTQQRTEMTTEVQTWNTDLANWEAQDSQLRATLTAPPASGGTADTTGQSDRMAGSPPTSRTWRRSVRRSRLWSRR
jgi:hypothetical protein